MEEMEKASLDILRRLGPAMTKYLRCDSVKLIEERTTAYPWGWVFYFVDESCKNPANSKRCVWAYEKETRKLAPVGTKGLEFALEQFEKQPPPES